jgi:hypothetical protein
VDLGAKQSGLQERKKEKCRNSLHLLWLIWKERNNRISENSEKSAQQMAATILEEIKLQLMIYSIP